MASNKTPNLGMDSWAETDYFKRTELNGNFGKIDNKFGVLDTFSVNVKTFGAKGDYDDVKGTGTDDTKAFKDAIMKIKKFYQDTNYSMPIELFIPAGNYKITDTLDFSPLVGHSTSSSKKAFYTVRGASYQATKLFFSKDNSDGMFFSKCQIKLSDMYIKHSGVNGVALRFGDTIYRDPADNVLTVVNQSSISHLNVYGNPIAVEIDYMFDTTFQDCHFASIQNNTNTDTSAAVFKVNPLSDDMSNHITFLRCHWEGTVSNSTQLKCDGGVNQIHTFNFLGCHFETRNQSTRCFDFKNVKGFTFTGCVFMRNGYYTADAMTTERANIIQEAWSVGFYNCNFNATNGILNAPYIALVGGVSGLEITNTIMNGSTYYDINRYVDPSSVSDINTYRSTWNFNILRGSAASTGYKGKYKAFSGDIGFRRFEQQYGSVKGVDSLITQYASTQQTTSFDETTQNYMSFNQNGVLSVAGHTSNTQKNITSNGSFTFNIPSSNINKRGMFMVMMDNSAETFALVFSTGASLVPISVGSSAIVGNTLPGTTSGSKMYVYLNGRDIAVTNTFSSDRAVMVVPFVF